MAKHQMNALDYTAIVLLIAGGLNWGLRIFSINIVNMLLHNMPIVENIVYGLIGVSALYSIYSLANSAR
jgi:uncharacterized protein